jgi:hypothetical protein
MCVLRPRSFFFFFFFKIGGIVWTWDSEWLTQITFWSVVYSTDAMGKELPGWSGCTTGRCTEYWGYQQLTAWWMLEAGAAWTIALLLITSNHFTKWNWKYSATPMKFTKSAAKRILNIEFGDVCGRLFMVVMSVSISHVLTNRTITQRDQKLLWWGQ